MMPKSALLFSTGGGGSTGVKPPEGLGWSSVDNPGTTPAAMEAEDVTAAAAEVAAVFDSRYME